MSSKLGLGADLLADFCERSPALRHLAWTSPVWLRRVRNRQSSESIHQYQLKLIKCWMKILVFLGSCDQANDSFAISPGELHLSHNRIKAHGAVVIVHAAERSRTGWKGLYLGGWNLGTCEFPMGLLIGRIPRICGSWVYHSLAIGTAFRKHNKMGKTVSIHGQFPEKNGKWTGQAVRRTAANCSPLWLRLERNAVEHAGDIADALQQRLSVCFRSDRPDMDRHGAGNFWHSQVVSGKWSASTGTWWNLIDCALFVLRFHW